MKFILLILLSTLVTSISQCTCSQLTIESDCSQNTSCYWYNNQCSADKPSTTPTQQDSTSSLYCQNFSQSQCVEEAGCMFLNSKCTFFSGCTTQLLRSDSQCQLVSRRCLTDGTRCIEKGACATYTSENACKNLNLLGLYCYWDGSKCSDADTCTKLPTSLDTDAKCRAQLSTCTTNSKGCVDSGTSCSDQKYEYQCVWNKSQSQKCFWRDGSCFDYVCANASQNIVTDTGCTLFLSTCTTKKDGGCVERSSCSASMIQAACVKNSAGDPCYWTGTACVDKTCSVLPTTLTTNKECEEQLSGCITKKDGGCVTNSGCTSANIESACEKFNDKICFWNSDNQSCVEKKCENAPTSLVSFEACTSFLNTCTLNPTSRGCVTRTCSNAPTSITDCQSYLNTCLDRKDGGCESLSTCELVTLEKNCITNASGGACFWDGVCKTKICANAPSNLINHSQCEAFLSGCTVNATSNGCVQATCNNILTESSCLLDYEGQRCQWSGNCFIKYCSNAPQTYNTHSQCVKWLSNCTVNDNLKGCMEIPYECSTLNESQCYINRSGQDCTFVNSKCQTKSCATAIPITAFTTTTLCQSYMSTCMLSNSKQGCLATSTACADRVQDNCTRQVLSTDPKCVYFNNLCTNVACKHATDTTYYTTTAKCQEFKSDCIVNSTNNGCIDKPEICGGLTASQCADRVLQSGGNCFWTGTQCIDKICSQAPSSDYQSHVKCQEWGTACTVSDQFGVGCINKLSDCYMMDNSQCSSTLTGQKCYWNTAIKLCQDQICSNATAVSSQTQCQAFSTNCSINQASNGCIDMQTNCSAYAQASCGWSKTDGRCFWDGSSCKKALCSHFTTNCTSLVGMLCTLAGSACVDRTCTGTAAPTSVTKHTDCLNWLSTCSGNQAQTSCMTMKDTCSLYTTATDCGWSKLNGRCYMDNGSCSRVSSCEQVYLSSYTVDKCYALSDFKCTNYSYCDSQPCSMASPKTTQAECQAFSTECAINSTSNDCITIQSTCSGYTISTSCTHSKEGTCVWDSTANNNNGGCTNSACTNATTKTSQTACQAFSTNCVINSTNNDCISIQLNCSDYSLQTSCTYSKTGKCSWDSTANGNAGGCILAACSSATTKTSQTACQSYSSYCSVNSAANDCITRQAQCSAYSEANCAYSQEGKCVWSSGACTNADCSTATTFSSFSACQSFSLKCSVNASFSKCIPIQNACGAYAQGDCKWSLNEGQCLWDSSNSKCVQATCASASSNSVVVTSSICSSISILKCYLQTESFCKTRECSGKYGPQSMTSISIRSQQDCQNWSSTCSINNDQNGCVVMASQCSNHLTKYNCGWSANDGRCVWLNDACTKGTCNQVVLTSYSLTTCNGISDLSCTFKTGDSKCSDRQCSGDYGPTSTVSSNNDCQNWSSLCSINGNGNGCVRIMNQCSSYSDQINCGQSQESQCYWDQSNGVCINRLCEQAKLQTSNIECELYMSKCTIKKTGGCQDLLTQCTNYKNISQCFKTQSNITCYWSSNYGKCLEKTCNNLDQTSQFDTHYKCNSYLSTCTVRSDNGAIANGCMDLATCTLYSIQEQCQIDSTNQICQWKDSKCLARSCDLADTAYTTHDQCYAYLLATAPKPTQRCTVNITDGKAGGCMTVKTCLEYQNKEQCVIDSAGTACYWVEEIKQCQVKSCSNAPSNSTCSAHLAQCGGSSFKCNSTVCEYYLYKTEEDCKKQNSKCTSNGTYCILKTTCDKTIAQLACTTDINDTLCTWSNNRCTIKSCSTASISLTTEEECNNYLSGCTTREGGGCQSKSTCNSITFESACTTDKDGTPCKWESVTKKCRNQGCQDYTGANYLECKAKNCTYGGSEKCQSITSCSLYKSEETCIYGTEGACLWVGTSCYAYTGCGSLNWTTDAQCKSISNQCTSNGSSCIAITGCSETNINGGCVTGTDGTCAQVDGTCSLFKSCTDIPYTTHAKCQETNSSCTSNLKSVCIPLAECSTYTSQDNCKIDANKKTCVWENSACRAQGCSDATNDSDCTALGCLFAGSQCIQQNSCANYSNSICVLLKGTEGTCILDANTCRAMKCSEIVTGVNHNICKSYVNACVSDGSKCVAYSTCSSYLTKTACNYGGTDGTCTWNVKNSQCVLMTSCILASTDEVACKAKSTSCKWTVNSDNTTTCTDLSCSTIDLCKAFLSFNNQLVTCMTQSNNECQYIDPATIESSTQCYSITKGYYSWNKDSYKCVSCSEQQVNNTNTTNYGQQYIQIGLIMLILNQI